VFVVRRGVGGFGVKNIGIICSELEFEGPWEELWVEGHAVEELPRRLWFEEVGGWRAI
jgi:hypothetical protein